MSDRKNSKSYVAEAVIATSILVLGASVYLWYHSRPKKDGGNNGSTDLVATEHMREVRLKRFDRPGASCVSRARYNTSKTTATSKKFRLPIPNVIGTKSDGGSDNAHYHASPETREDLNRMVKKKPITQVTEPTNNLAGGINANIRAPSSKIGKKSQQNADAKVLATSATVNDRKVTAGTVAAELRKPPVTGIAEEVEAEVEAEVEVEVEAEVEAYGGSGDVEQIYLTNENKIKYVFGEGYYLSLLSNGAGAGADVSARSGGDGDGGNDNGGEDRNITSSSLILLLRNVSQTEKALELAAGWWRKTLELSCRSSSALPITLWQTAILNSVNELLSERTPEEDIFTILSPEEDFAKPFLALLGYTLVNETSRVASPSGGGAALYSVRRKNPTTGTSAHRIPASFMRVVSSCHPVSARTALELLFSSLFGKYRLDTLPEHALDVGVLQALRQDRAVGGMLGVALQWEVLARPRQAQQQVIATTTTTTTTTTESSSTSATRNRTPISSCTTHLVSAGQMERNCVLAPLMCLTTIVPLTRVTGTNRGTQETTSSAKYPQESFFADPSYVRSSGGGGSATDMGRYIPEVGKLMHMLQRNMAEVTGLLHDLIESAMKQKENREGVLTWMSHILHVNHRFFSEGGHRDLREDELSCPDASSSGFILNFCSVMLLLMHPLLSNPGKFVPQVDWCFAMTDTRIDFSQLANLVDGSKVAVSTHSATSSSSSSSSLAPSSSPSHGGSICQEEEEDATEAVAKNASASSSGSPALDDTSSSSSSSSACSSSSSSSSSSAFSFATEIFWLTGRAMELLVKLDRRRNEHMQVVGIHFEHLKQQYNAAPSSDLEEALGRAKRNIHTLHCGWAASQLGDVEFLSQACRWAQFASQWLIEQARSTDATERFRHCPAGLVKAMCEVWLLAARLPQLPQHRPSREAMPGTLPADAALLCVELMGRPDLCGSAVVQDRLLEVVGVFVGSTASAGGGGGGKQPARMTMKSMPAPRNSLADVVMNNSVIREQLVPAIMQLYSNCHAVAALDVNEDVSFDKNSLRHRANGIIESLYRYPLEEPRASIRTFVHQNAVGFEAFVVSAFDCIMYNFVEAIKTLIFYRQRQQQWKQQTTAWSEGKQAILPLGEEESRMRGKVKTMLRMTQSTYEMLQLLCEGEGCVCDGILRNASLRHRVSYYLYSCLNYVNSEAKLAKLEVEDAKEDWGVDLALVVSQPVKLIAVLLIHASSEDDKVTKENKGEQKTGGGGGGGGSLAHAFLSSLAEHPDFEWDDLLNVASLPGGEMLHSSTDLIRSMKNESTGMNSTSSIGTALSSSSSSSSSSYSLSKASETPDKNISKIDDTIDFDMYIHEEGDAVDAYAKFWDTEEQVAAVENGFAGGNFFQRIHSAHAAGANGGSGGTTTTGGGGGGGSGLRAIIRDYTKKTKAMLPPALRDATIAIRYDEDQPSYGRAFLTGPVDSPYFGGIFIFDIYFPKDFPTVPPLVQLLNTAGGTERFHPNLYADGKVCVSLLGTNEGHATERWDAKVSSLGQVLVSIQSLILGEYLPGAVGQHVTVDGRHVTAEDYYEYRLATLRHAILPLLQSCRGAGPYAAAFPELQPLFLAYFRANRHRMLQVLKHSIEDLQQPSGSSSSNSSGGGGGAAAAKLRKEVSRLVAEFHKCDSL